MNRRFSGLKDAVRKAKFHCVSLGSASSRRHLTMLPKVGKHRPAPEHNVIDLTSDSDNDLRSAAAKLSKVEVSSQRDGNSLPRSLDLENEQDRLVSIFPSAGTQHIPLWDDALHHLDASGVGPRDLLQDPRWSDNGELRIRRNPVGDHMNHQDTPQPTKYVDMKDQYVLEVLAIFPDICRDYVSTLYDEGIENLVDHILDNLDEGSQYPLHKDTLKSLKRKREKSEDETAEDGYKRIDRGRVGLDYSQTTRLALGAEFPRIPLTFIDAALRLSNYHLFPAYTFLEEAQRTWNPANPSYNEIKSARKVVTKYNPVEVDALLANKSTSPDKMLALRELVAARRMRLKADEKRRAERQAELDEEENTRQAERDGTMTECGCCFSDYPLNRMVHCNSEQALHWFCRSCARQAAENEIGNSKYVLNCISMDSCEATFSHEQKMQFLDEKSWIALDRNEQEAVLRMAGIENLESCPFCPFAAEYPPVEEERLFRCQAPNCEMISCRLCKRESHIPKTCEESAKERGLSVRRQIEEAMSAALIRKCNRCGTPFVKEEGCNKMTCTRNGCFNVQCYVCSKSCSYNHFDDRGRGGKSGNCPLFESVYERHDNEVKKAEQEALAKVRADHPEFNDEDLKVKVSDLVKQDELRLKANDPRANLPVLPIAHPALDIAGRHDIARRVFNDRLVAQAPYAALQPAQVLPAFRPDQVVPAFDLMPPELQYAPPPLQWTPPAWSQGANEHLPNHPRR